MAFRVYKGAEFVFQHSVHNSDRAYFGYAVYGSGKSGCFEVESDYFIFKGNVRIPVDCFYGVVHIVSLNAENRLEAFILESIYGVHNLRKALHHSVIRYGNSPVAPVMGTLHQLFGRGYSVHLGHICMHVEFKAFLRLIVSPVNPFNFTYISGSNGYVMLIFIKGSFTVYEDSRSRFQGEHVFGVLLFGYNFKGYGACEVGYHYGNYDAFPVPCLP